MKKFEAIISCNFCNHKRVLTSDYLKEISNRLSIDPLDVNEHTLSEILNRFSCSKCGAKDAKLNIEGDAQQIVFDNSELAKTCIICGKPIPLKRLESVPNTEKCVSCQEKLEKGKEEPIYCKKCGARMVWRVRTTVLPVKYFLGCSNYPKCTFVISGSW